jgi:hypothetical protein
MMDRRRPSPAFRGQKLVSIGHCAGDALRVALHAVLALSRTRQFSGVQMPPAPRYCNRLVRGKRFGVACVISRSIPQALQARA